LIPTVCPTKTWLRLIFRRLKADAAAGCDGGSDVMEWVIDLRIAASVT
jgi:hypothetical protein